MHSFYSILMFLSVASCSFMVVEALKCRQGILAQYNDYDPYTDCKHKCKMLVYHGTPNIFGCPEPENKLGDLMINKTVDGDELTCYKEYSEPNYFETTRKPTRYDRERKLESDLRLSCFCGKKLCNAYNSNLHDEVFKYTQNIIGNNHFECLEGTIYANAEANVNRHLSNWQCGKAFPPDESVLKKCVIEYSWVRSYIYSGPRYEYACARKIYGLISNEIETEDAHNYTIVNVAGNANLTCYYDKNKLDRIQCVCDTHGCNDIGSAIHNEMLNIVYKETGINLTEAFEETNLSLITTTSTTEKSVKITEATVQSPKSSSEPAKDQPDNQNAEANESDEYNDEETATKGSKSYKTALSIIIFVFCILVSRDRHFM